MARGDVKTEERGGFVIITPKVKELDVYNKSIIADGLENHVRDQVIIDLLEVEYFDSELIKVLLSFALEANKSNGSLKIICSDRGKRIIGMSKLSDFFQIFETLRAAMQRE